MLVISAYTAEVSAFSTRTAQPDDIDALYTMICELAIYEGKDLQTLPLSKENLLKYGFGETPYFHVELAENENGVIGYATYFYCFSANQGSPYIFIDDLYVKPSAQHLGVGTCLLKEIAGHAQAAGCCRIEGYVFNWNEKAIEFYQNIGGIERKDLLVIRLGKENFNKLMEK